MNGEEEKETGLVDTGYVRSGGQDVQPGAPGGESTAQAEAARGLVKWIAAHPRAALIVFLVALLPYLFVCWGAAVTVASALAGGGCGG